jgi:hypothetical protein
MQQMGGMGYSNKMENVLERVLETQNAILTKLNADELEEEDEPEQNTLGSMLNSPQIQALLISGVSKLLGIGTMDAQGASIAGIDDVNENEAIMILNSLMSKGVSVDHLRKLNAMSPAKLSSLLIML